jgi:hypothetical protein
MSIQKPSDDFELLLHVAENPELHLGRKAIRLFEGFTMGYRIGLPVGVDFRWLPKPEFEAFVREKFPTPERWPYNLSAVSFIDFLGGDDADAFNLDVGVCRAYFEAHPPKPPAPPPVSVTDGVQAYDPVQAHSLTTMLESVCKRPAMYFGNSDQIGGLVAWLNGCVEAERVHTGVSETAALLERFQAWLNVRHPWALGRAWHRILLFQNLWAQAWAITAFWTYFDMFQKGELPDALTPAGKKVFEKVFEEGDAEDMAESEREDRKKQFNRIFYRT